jgi:hypothetical protein
MWKFVTPREEHKMRVFGPRREEVTGGWRKLHNEELYNLYFSPAIIRVMKLRMMSVGVCSMHGRD